MGRNNTIKYGDPEDDVEVHLSEIIDEEAQLLGGEDYEQFELDEGPRPAPRQQPSPQSQSRSRGFWTRQRTPRWLAFLHGPDPLKVHTINPLFPSVQELPVRWLEKSLPRRWQRIVLLVVFLVAWAASLAIPLTLSKGTATNASGTAIRHVDCVDTLWKRNNECGLDGVDCRPFSNTSFAFRCPADCASVRVLNPHHVGNQDVNFRPLVIGGGGGGPYRGDSFLCGAAIHAGAIDDATGGCGVATLVGEYYQYFSSAQHNIDSIPFDSYFPLSFTITTDPGLKCTAPDPRWTVSLPLSLLFTTLLTLFTTSPPLLFFTTFLGIFTHVALVSDPPNLSTPSTTYLLPSLISHYAARLLPALFTAAILYLTCVRHALPSSTNPNLSLEKTLLWLAPFWLGALSNRTLEPLIPIARLTPSDLTAQPGALLALGVVITTILLIAAVQARTFYLSGHLPAYLLLYLTLGVSLGLLAALPHLHLRIHHYVLALLLLPGTAAQTRVSLICQGLLLGLFVNGVARWGFDSVLQTGEMLRGDGGLGGLVPEVVAPLIERLVASTTGGGEGGMRIWFKWKALAEGLLNGKGSGRMAVEGISVLVNDVERYRGWFAERPLEEQVFTWTRRVGGVVADEYFRFGFVAEGGRALDYTEAGTWFVNGSWSQGTGYW
ncbi:cysteine-rich secretory protein LCCL domain-containing 2 [Parachaetomium inaequale]|uniref:Cysteine-rich secretory protein LCCL domain-containing 2 n=1 Tax=Parachaetomium inaequale TaxID=2588326 RepID=A0AAN6PQX9_9PEZI|nr:cysteine-rich secretory protein LCCL domain-containing 2 [Parachaetomium inaequale]